MHKPSNVYLKSNELTGAKKLAIFHGGGMGNIQASAEAVGERQMLYQHEWRQQHPSGLAIRNESPYHSSRSPRLGIDLEKLKLRMHKRNYVHSESPLTTETSYKDMFSLIHVK